MIFTFTYEELIGEFGWPAVQNVLGLCSKCYPITEQDHATKVDLTRAQLCELCKGTK